MLVVLLAAFAHAGWVTDSYAGMDVLLPDALSYATPGTPSAANLPGTSIRAQWSQPGCWGPREYLADAKKNLGYYFKKLAITSGPTCTDGPVTICTVTGTGAQGPTDVSFQVTLAAEGSHCATEQLVTGSASDLGANRELLAALAAGFAPTGTKLAPPPAPPAPAAPPKCDDYLAPGADQACPALCEQGDYRACYQLGRLVELRSTDDWQVDQAVTHYARSLKLAEAACRERDDLEACFFAADSYSLGAGVPNHGGPPGDWGGMGYSQLWPWPEKADELRRKALDGYRGRCDGGDAAACVGLGEATRFSDAKGAAAAFRQACRASSPDGCAKLQELVGELKEYDPDAYDRVCKPDPTLCAP